VNGQVGAFREVLAELIGDLLRAGQSVRSIAARLGRSPSTVSRDRP
jgi:IS30 family transposase